MSARDRDDDTWDAFITWLRADRRPATHVEAVMRAYREELVASGSSPDDALASMGRITRLLSERRDAWPPMFDRIYASDQADFSTRPNAFLVEVTASRRPGRALEIGVGQGRNAAFLAASGWDVTGVDVSDTGLKAAHANAARVGATIRTVLVDPDDDFDPGRDEWDLIVLTYVPVPIEDAAYAARLRAALAPGGLIVIESFAVSDELPVRRPVDFELHAVRAAFNGLRELRTEDTVAPADWAARPVRVMRYAAEKATPA